MNNNLGSIFTALDISPENGLAIKDSLSDMTIYQKLFFKQVQDKIGIDAVYFLRDPDGIPKIPLIYFSAMDKYDADKVATLHRLAWNLGEAPLLFVVTPDELKIFNNYKTPRKKDGSLDPKAGLIRTIKLATDLESQRQQLIHYNRIQLESGDFWRTSNIRFDSKARVDVTLMNNLKIMRRTLIQKINKRLNKEQQKNINVISIVHALLSRSILIKYLEERKDSNSDSVFPIGFYSQFLDQANCYTDVLTSKEATYRLFDCLKDKFNGDMLPLVADELDIVNEDDLKMLRLFLLGDTELESQQLALWPLYSFDVIPIQLISSIYELFFHLSDNDDDKGTYYTPLHLVDMLMDEVYPWEGAFSPVTFLDPSCGSGIFLVEAYRRLVCRWMHSNSKTSISNNELTALLENCIFGVDLNEEAVRVASFSLSLAICDFLDPKSIWDSLSFPNLTQKNLFISDFFDKDAVFNTHNYDIVIGNPPWQSQMTELADQYINEHKKTVGDKQIAQAFSLKCSDICKDNGIVCLLLPSKGFLFNRSNKSKKYRTDFFNANDVIVIINFSIYRKFLFDHASGPAVGVIYRPHKNVDNVPIFYCTPKPLYTIEDIRKFTIEPNDICRIPRDIVSDDRIWKIAMWGGPRDLELIDKIQSSFCTLKKFLGDFGMKSAEGYNIGNGAKTCNDFIGMPHITVDNFGEYYISKEDLPQVDFNRFQVSTDKNREVYKAPHLIIKQSHKKTHFLSVVLDYDALFNHSFLGIHGDAALLKYLSLIIGSKVFSYYHLMTNRRWLVERDELEAGDIRTTPIPKPTTHQLEQAMAIYDSISSGEPEEIRDEYVYNLYNLEPYEILIVNDAINYLYDYFTAKNKSFVFSRPNEGDYIQYNSTINMILQNTFGKRVIQTSQFFVGQSPLSVLLLSLDGPPGDTPKWNRDNVAIQSLLHRLDEMLLDKRQNVFIRRNVRVYGKDSIYIIKPTQKKYWNYSAACRDADEIFSDIMKAWRCDNE
ncbi:HsdM family class I SAM-dependent methyltransferase [Caproicibacter sp. BJN0012]|uniref:HsdM family class I SAM-dependent methyltransferase n=1 Tax=Caproicibacter sp. BJN0012 TaxID=3110227 RepID=UPI002E12FB16|nr:N-6 DNA methylase [Caproicibacter sp. BJN0012]